MKVRASYFRVVDSLKKLESLPLLFMRWVLAYGFWTTGSMKWHDIHAVGDWFASLNYPFPYVNAYLAAGTEILGVVLLFLGLGVRIISVPLMFVMVVAITTVHWGNGFEAGNNGFEIPLYYLIMLFALFVYGGGRYSLDSLLSKRNG